MWLALTEILALLARIGPLLARAWAWLRASKWAGWLIFYLLEFMGGIIGTIMKWLGVSFVVTKFALPSLTPLIANQLLSLPAEWGQFLALTKVDQGITIILSAVVIRSVDRIQVKRRRDAWQTPL